MVKHRVLGKSDFRLVGAKPQQQYSQWIRRCLVKRCSSLFRQHLFSLIWMLLLCAILLLTLINVLMSLKLTYFSTKRDNENTINESQWFPYWYNGDSHQVPSMVTVDYSECPSNKKSAFRFINGTGRFDNSRKYLIHDFVQVGNEWKTLRTSQLVCLATQTSVDQMFWLVEGSQYWQGPMSVAVFVPGEDFHIAVHFIQHLRHCFPVIRDNVSFHFAYPMKHPPLHIASIRNMALSCQKWVSNLKTLLNSRPRSMSTWRTTLLYPQNHLRNVARKGCQSSFVFLTDVDIIPRWKLCEALNTFLQHPPCEHCVFVIPTYEVDNKVVLPRNKTALVNLVKLKKAQPFHNVVFINNQFATNASKWENLPEEDGITVAYPVTNFELYYEPFYISRDDVPPHDERFIGYGYTRNTQVYEMHVANYKFLVLNNAYAMHRGLKLNKSKNSWREKQNRANSRKFKKFEKEILARY